VTNYRKFHLEAAQQVGDPKSTAPHFPEVLPLTVTGGDTIRFVEYVEEVNKPGEIDSLHVKLDAKLKVPSRHRQVD